MEDILNFNFHYGHTYELDLMSTKDKLISIFKTLNTKFNYKLNVTEADFKSIKIIYNKDIQKIEKGFVAQKNFAFVSPNIIKDLQDNGFVLDSYPKCDVFIGNHNIIFENISKIYKHCLQCIIYEDYDFFTNEYIIRYEDKDTLNEHKQLITSKYLNYFFDENKIKMDESMEQFIYNSQ